MKIYGFPLSPFVRKVLVAAQEKGLEVELVPTNPQQPDDAFLACSPFRKIPAMDDDGFTLADSTAIIAYLDARHPRPLLIPEEPRARGKAIWFEEVGDTVLVPTAVGMVLNRFLRPRLFGTPGDEAAAQASEEAVKTPLAYLESVADADGFVGTFSVGDIAIASVIRTLGYAGWELDDATYPRLTTWYDRVRERPGWRAAAEIEARIFSAVAA